MEALKQIIEESFGLRPEHFPPEVQNSVDEVSKLLQQGNFASRKKLTAIGSRTNGSKKPFF